jgi:hypothetical protein
MAKGQLRSNREAKKPKQVKKTAPASSPFPTVTAKAQTAAAESKQKR